MTTQTSTEKFIIKAKIVHGNKYIYSKINYINAKQKKHDLLKKELSRNNGVFLIVIPYCTTDKESFIGTQLEFCQFLRICL